MSRDTTWTWPGSPTREDRDAFQGWLRTYFEGNWEPRATGGFDYSMYGDGLTMCRSCGAMVMQGSGEDALNLHRSWHDRNDRD